jgi:hypothetical protein
MDEFDILARQRFRDERSGKRRDYLIDGPAEDDDPDDPDELVELLDPWSLA